MRASIWAKGLKRGCGRGRREDGGPPPSVSVELDGALGLLREPVPVRRNSCSSAGLMPCSNARRRVRSLGESGFGCDGPAAGSPGGAGVGAALPVGADVVAVAAVVVVGAVAVVVAAAALAAASSSALF